jgi:hypothetical protein
MQENDQVWKEFDAKYKFNTIYFYRHDYTPWGQAFMISRIRDSFWVPVFVDDYILILVKNDVKNETVIKNYALPKSIFSIK